MDYKHTDPVGTCRRRRRCRILFDVQQKKRGRHLGKFVHRVHTAHRPRVAAERCGEAETQILCERANRKKRAAREQQYENGTRLLNVVVVKVLLESFVFFFGVLDPPADCRWRTSAEGSLSDLLKVGFLLEVSKSPK